MRVDRRGTAAQAHSWHWDLWARGWRAGSAIVAADEPVFVSITDFHVHRARHAPAAWLTGLRLRASWQWIPGSVGLWLWAEPHKLRSGSVSIWSREEDLTAFVRSPGHLEIMRRFRPKMSGTSQGWTASSCDRAEIWREAVRRLAASTERAWVTAASGPCAR